MKVLIVEDEMLVAMAMKINLESSGYEVVGISPNAHTFWQCMESEPDVILLDIRLKNKESGITLAKKIREVNEEIPIIFTTGNPKKETQNQIRKINNSVVLTKPILYEDLLAHLKACSNS